MLLRKTFQVDRKRIRELIKQKHSIREKVEVKTKGSHSKRLGGSGKKINDKELEGHVLEWVSSQRSKHLQVSRKQIMRKAKQYAKLRAEKEARLSGFSASRGWLEKLMYRNGLSLRRRTTQAQTTPDKIIEKLVSYIFYIRRLKEKKQV